MLRKGLVWWACVLCRCPRLEVGASSTAVLLMGGLPRRRALEGPGPLLCVTGMPVGLLPPGKDFSWSLTLHQ